MNEATKKRPVSQIPQTAQRRRDARDGGYDSVAYRLSAPDAYHDGIVAAMLDRGWDPASHLEQIATELLDLATRIRRQRCAE